MAAISVLNPKAEFAKAQQALAINISAAKGLQDVLKTNLGPKGTIKMWVLKYLHYCKMQFLVVSSGCFGFP